MKRTRTRANLYRETAGILTRAGLEAIVTQAEYGKETARMDIIALVNALEDAQVIVEAATRWRQCRYPNKRSYHADCDADMDLVSAIDHPGGIE